MVFRTVIIDQEMHRKQLRFTKSTFQYLKDESKQSVRPVSKGVLVYEMVMMFSDSLSDEITEKEERVNNRLTSLTDTSLQCEVDSVKVKYQDGNYPSQHRINPDGDLTDRLKDIYLPLRVHEYLEEEWGQRYWAQHVDDLVIDYIDSAFESRYDRYCCKEELCEYIENGVKPDHRVALSIVEADTSRYEVGPASGIIDTDKWYLRLDLSHGEIIDKVEEEFDHSTPLDQKIECSSEIIDRYAEEREMEMPRNLAKALISDAFNISDEHVENEYLPEIDLPDYSSVEKDSDDGSDMVEYYQRCQEAKESLIEFLEEENEESKRNKIKRMNAPNVCLVEREDIEELDELEELSQRNEKIREILDKGSYSSVFKINQQSRLHEELLEQMREETE